MSTQVLLNRLRALSKQSPDGSHTLLAQLQEQLSLLHPRALCRADKALARPAAPSLRTTRPSPPSHHPLSPRCAWHARRHGCIRASPQAFRVNFVGEAADDHGGPYREAITQICGELQSGQLPLLLRCPNGRHGVGAGRDVYLPRPAASSARELGWFRFVGQLLGLALRQKETQLPLNLPSLVWKQLVSQPLDESDLRRHLQKIASKSCW